MAPEMKLPPLFDWHCENGARFTEFAGWKMPLQYAAGPIAEHRAVRSSAGLFDISHMGRLLFTDDATSHLLDRLISSDILNLPDGGTRYGLLCRDDGGILDDVFVYRHGSEFTVVVNAANTQKAVEWIGSHAGGSVEMHDATARTCMFALQGPSAFSILAALGRPDFEQLERFATTRTTLGNTPVIVARTGYTGEDGVELILDTSAAPFVWESILDAGRTAGVDVSPIGLAARDSLRFEPGFPLYGHELDETIVPPEALLKWACDFSRDFIGRDAIQRKIDAGLDRKLATVVMEEKAVPRHGYAVSGENGEEIGVVTSGMYAPTLDVYAANVLVSAEHTRRDTRLFIDIRGSAYAARVVRRPLYTPAYRA
ncbi:MAG: glycine cleavage system aminomethyltransferase GcvT [Spirochaetaceae bacterium]|nr:MAG: glycine cleavage system aminomethyltransferase GcvT [Spirochaetaceae bacterium]